MSDRLPGKRKRAPRATTQDAPPDKWTTLRSGGDRTSLSWGDADPEDLQGAIAAVTEDGAAVLLSRTSDGGALVLKILTDSGSTPFYPANSSALAEILAMVLEVATGTHETA